MIIVLLVISLIILAAGIILCGIASYRSDGGIGNWAYHHDGFWISLIIIGCILTVITLIFTIDLAYSCSTEKAINAKIEMYQQENKNIETVVAETVKNYQDYEIETFSNLKPQEVMVAISMYPELKSNELVVKQLSIYSTNNDKIKELKTKQIDLITKKWWLYFGK